MKKNMDDSCQKKISFAVRVFVCLLFAVVIGFPTGVVVGEFYGPFIGLRAGLIAGLIAWLISLIAMLKDYYYSVYANWPDFRM